LLAASAYHYPVRKVIRDKFSDLPISRQRKWQMRQRAKHKCSLCPAKAVRGHALCVKHLVATRERHQKTMNCKRRNLNALSYKLEKHGAKQLPQP
jgi:hypothetical protein